MSTETQYLALDLGGTQIKYGLIHAYGILHGKGHIPSRTDSLEHLREDLTSIKDSITETYDAVVVSLPGRIDTEAGTAYTGGSFKFLVNFPFQKEIEQIFSVPACIANDAKCAAAAELWKGSLQNAESAGLLILGTGLGGGIILDHKVYMGSSLTAAELCFVAADYDRIYDVDPSAFLFDRVCTGALLRYYAKQTNTDPSSIDGITLFNRYEANEPEAVQAVEWLAANTAIAIYSLQCVLDVETWAIGGGISARESLLNAIQIKVDELFDKLSVTPVRKPEVCPCQFRNDANLIGALYFYLEKNH